MSDPSQHHLMILMPTWVGDIVMATPSLRWLRERLKDARITAVTRPGMSPLLSGLESIDDAWRSIPVESVDCCVQGERSREEDDHVIILPNSMRTALLAFLSRSPERSGFRRQGRGLLPDSGD